MNDSSPRWHQIAPSEFPWEREALAFIRQELPDQEPYQAWANLEFVGEDGAIQEVDLLVLSPKGLFLVEIKSWPGVLSGDTNTWTLEREGRSQTFDSPLLLANRKARKLASLLKRQKAARGAQFPYVEPLVFLSHPAIQLKLTGTARQGVVLRDRPAEGSSPARPGIRAALMRLDPSAHFQPGKVHVYRQVAQTVVRAVAEAGIRPSQRARRVGDFLLEELLFTGPQYQDWLAHHTSLPKIRRRVRLYPLANATGAEARAQIERAARREAEALEPLSHPGVLSPLQFTQSELGPALVFDYDPSSLRLDHYLAKTALGFQDRLALVRQVAETLRYVHEKRVFHRALSPQSILVRNPDAPRPELKIFNWQTAAHDPLATSQSGLSGTSHLDPLVDDASQVYLAPEALTVPDASPETLDVFSLGALAYLIFSGKPPAGSVFDLHEILRTGKGLQLAAGLDGANPHLADLVQLATHPVVGERIASVADFLGYLDIVEGEMARPEEEPVEDPTTAHAGDLLPGGFRVRKRLGKGSTAVVFLVERDGNPQVLKLALDAQADERLQAEAEILRRLDHPRIVQLRDDVRVGPRLGLLLPYAEEGSLAQRLRTEGRLQLEFLQRWGEDLLQAVDYLERTGVPHRDIKPDNLGIAKAGRNDERHLVLFDFSLSRTPAENIFAGTRPYLDPFLRQRKPRRWDLQAERFAAAVTLYEMATGALPRWGDGQSDPGMIDEEVHQDSELLDAVVRQSLSAFFRQALQRAPKERFDNAEEMLAGWRRAFEQADRPPTTVSAEEQPDELRRACEKATLETSVSLLHLSTRAVNALDRAQVVTVGDLLRLPASRVSHMRGVGSKTRKELLEAIRLLADRLGRPATTAADEIESPATVATTTPAITSLDLLLRQILPADAKATGERRALETLFGLADTASPPWPSQSDVAETLGLTRARISQVLIKARQRWARNANLSVLRDDVVRLLENHAGAMTSRELSTALLAIRGSAQEEPLRTLHAAAALRAATEAEESQKGGARWRIRRGGDRISFALTQMEGGAEGEALLDFVDALGRAADSLASQDPLPSPQRALETLQAVPGPSPVPMSPERLLRLATAASTTAALSSRLEIYPRDLAPERALRLASGSLLGASELSVETVRSRVQSRYPEAPELPSRPRLDDLLLQVGLKWDSSALKGQGGYRFPETVASTFSSTLLPGLRTTASPGTSPGSAPGGELPSAAVDIRLFEDRLQRAAREGAFLALFVDETSLPAAEAALARRFPVEGVSLEAVWLDAMHRLADENRVEWERVLLSDAEPPSHPDAKILHTFVSQALKPVEARLSTSDRTVLLTRPGLLARYGQMSLLERLRDRVTRRPAPGESGLHGLWFLVPSSGTIDGAPVTVLPGQSVRIPEAWLHANSSQD